MQDTQEQMLIAQQAFLTGQYELAASIWKALIEIAPDAETRRSHALTYTEVLQAQGEDSEARSLLEQLHDETDSPLYLHRLGQLEHNAGRHAEALAYFQAEARALTPADAEAQSLNALARGLTAFSLGEQRYALACVEEALDGAKRLNVPTLEAEAQTLRGEIAVASGQNQLAREAYADAAVAYAKAQNPLAEQAMADRITKLSAL